MEKRVNFKIISVDELFEDNNIYLYSQLWTSQVHNVFEFTFLHNYSLSLEKIQLSILPVVLSIFIHIQLSSKSMKKGLKFF